MLTETNIRDLLAKGERLTLECKLCAAKLPNSLWETYSAFANSYGGYILLGIEEHRGETDPSKRFTIHGVSDSLKLKTDFWNLANDSNKISKNLLVDDDVQIVSVDGNDIIAIHIPQAPYNVRPVIVNQNLQHGVYKRNHEGDYHCSDNELRMMLRDANENGNDLLLLEHYTMDDIDAASLREYRQMFQTRNPDHWLNKKDDKEFLMQLGGYAVNRQTSEEGLTMAGLLMFGKGLPIRERFDNIRFDYVDKTNLSREMRYSDRLTYDLTWENNLFQFFTLTIPRLTRDLPRPFVLEGMQRKDDTPAHRMIREAFTNMIIHADFMITGVLKVEKREDGFFFSNPGMLRLPIEDIYRGGTSLARNPHMQDIMRMIGFGENLGTGFPTIVATWEKYYHMRPILSEHASIYATELLLPLSKETNSGKKVESIDKQQAIYELIKNNGSRDPLNEPLNEPLNTERIASLLEIPYSTTKRIIKELEQQKQIIRIGSKKTGYWEATEVLRAGDFVMLKNIDYYTSKYINKLNLFEIEKIAEDGYTLKNVKEVVNPNDLLPIPVDGIHDRNIYFHYSVAGTTGACSVVTGDKQYYMDAIKKRIPDLYKQQINELPYVHLVQRVLKSRPSLSLRIDNF